MKKVELKDFLDFKFISNLKVNENNEVVFCVNTCNYEENRYDHNLYMIKEGKLAPLTNGNNEENFVFMDNSVVFNAALQLEDLKKQAEGEELSGFNQILPDGEVIKLFSVPLNVTDFLNVDNDTFVLQVKYDNRYSYMYQLDDKSEILNRKKADTAYEVFTQIPFYANNAGYTSEIVNRLYLYQRSTEQLTAITESNLNVKSFILSDDKSKVYFIANRVLARPTLKDSVLVYDLKTEKLDVIIEERDYTISNIRMFNDDLLMIANKEVTYGKNENFKFFIIDILNKQAKMINRYPDSIGNSVGSDCRYGGGQIIKVYNNKCYFVSTINEQALLMALTKDGNVEMVLAIDGSIDCFDIVNEMIYFIAMKDGKLQEIYSYDFNEIKCLSAINTKLDDKYVAKYNEIKYENDGFEFTGWVLLPENYDATKKYPAILDIHGGPKTVYGKAYYHEMQLWVNMGYIVFFTNPRGSDGRGNEFMDIFGKYGTIDYDDLMKFTNLVLAKYSIDPTRVGVTGGSYGGFMSNWIITHTDRFACAATQRSISNWLSFYGTSDIGYFFTEDQIKGNIFTDPKKLWDHSPLKYADNVKTPTLFIHSDEDYRCPLEQGLQLYTALVDRGVESRFVMFKKENHELSRSGRPLNRVKRLQEITDWMEMYLMKKH